ncbi:MAG: ABC transporter ATP-binding protein [Deltaproteobacteria bacterium]|nr:ABC transporter ATP-binding protein [Deltaproteobacteria bacterium]
MLIVDRVSRRFGRQVALAEASLRAEPGAVVGVVGPNGAGKTTLLRIAVGFLDPDAGRVTIDGIDLAHDRRAAQARLGYLPESAPLPPEMRVGEYLQFRARLKGASARDGRAWVAAALGRTAIADVAGRVIATLSKGYRQRVGLADALLGEPPVVILDEPQSGLDPVQVRELRAVLAGLSENRTMVIASHAVAELAAIAARLVVIAGGRVIAEGAPEALRGEHATLDDAIVALLGAA